ncbi:hypothetical protein QBE55_02225 [Eubacteriales bacterium mix99]
MFYSILFPAQEHFEKPQQVKAPACFTDLNLDQIFGPVFQSIEEFDLEEYFYTPLQDPGVLNYRQDVMRELEKEELRILLVDFSNSAYWTGKYMKEIRSSLNSGDSWRNNYLTRGQMLDYADRYCHTVSVLNDAFSKQTFHSEGLRSFAGYLAAYCMSGDFTELYSHVKRLRDEFSTVKYCMLIKNGTIRVRKYEGQADHSEQILRTFERFRQSVAKDYRHKFTEEPYANHVEAAVLNMVAGLYKDIFADLNHFCCRFFQFEDETILRFSREIWFYLSWLAYVQPLRQTGLSFCYPKICDKPDHLHDFDCFDLALAQKKSGKIVVNDFRLDAPERVMVVTGPNQGGKTTFARAFGQVHYLASLGLCVPGREASLYLFDNIFTHFGREEDLSASNGKLQDDLVRLHDLFDKATHRSIIIINEIFASTTLSDALLLGGLMMDTLAELGAPSVLVTFLDELALHGQETVSMMSMVRKDDPTRRTFKVVRKPPDGLAYAVHIAGKHGLTYEQLCRRLKR